MTVKELLDEKKLNLERILQEEIIQFFIITYSLNPEELEKDSAFKRTLVQFFNKVKDELKYLEQQEMQINDDVKTEFSNRNPVEDLVREKIFAIITELWEKEQNKPENFAPKKDVTFELLEKTIAFIRQLNSFEKILFVYLNSTCKKCFNIIFKLNVFIDAILQPHCSSIFETYKFHKNYNFKLTRYKFEVSSFLPETEDERDNYIKKLDYYNVNIRPKIDELCNELQRELFHFLIEKLNDTNLYNITNENIDEDLAKKRKIFINKILQPCFSISNFYEFYEFQLINSDFSDSRFRRCISMNTYEREKYTGKGADKKEEALTFYLKKSTEIINIIKTKLNQANENSDKKSYCPLPDLKNQICNAIVNNSIQFIYLREIIYINDRLNRLYEAFINEP